MTSRSSSRRPRAGFTLIELLVTISILVILIGLTTSAVMNFRLMGPRVATRSNLNDIKSKVNAQWKAVRDQAQRENIPTSYQATVLSVAGATSLSDPRARAAYVQLKLAQAFPQSFNEVMNPTVSPNNLLPAWSAYTTYLSGLGVTTANASTIVTDLPTQQSICLMMILERGPRNPGVKAEDLGVTRTKSFTVGSTTTFGVADAFGSPLNFSRGSNGAVITSKNLLTTDDANQ